MINRYSLCEVVIDYELFSKVLQKEVHAGTVDFLELSTKRCMII